MKWETAKTFILIILIGTSLVLTFGMRNYQPDVTNLSDESIGEVNLGGTRDESKRTIVRPSEVIFKSNGNFFGFAKPKGREQMYDQMYSWTFTNFTTQVAGERNPGNYEIEVIFPDAIPLELFGSIMSFNEEDIFFPEWSFERLFITFTDKESMNIEFISTSGNEKATATVNNPNDYEQMWTYMTSLETDRFVDYTVMNTGTKNIYIPSGEMVLKKEAISFETIDPSDMRDILFPDPAVVMESTTTTSGLTYFTDSRQIRMGANNLVMEYVNPFTENSDPPLTVVSLLDSSISNLNENGSWTGDFKLAELNAYQNFVKYRLHYGGYPVFSSANPDLSVIEQKWNSQQLEEYRRPLFRLINSLQHSDVDLISAESLITKLKNHQSYTLEKIQDIRIGYRLNVNLEKNAIELEPAWHVKYDGHWRVPAFSEVSQEGGD
jgi:regulatory protein YycH of two-component signal transduction system YycFG